MVFCEGWIDTGKDGEEVGLECLNGALGLVVPMHVRWDFLVFVFPFIGYAINVCGTGFIVEDL